MEARTAVGTTSSIVVADEDTSAVDHLDSSRELECLRRLVEDGEVGTARVLVAELSRRWPDLAEVHYWARVLAPARVGVRSGVQGRSMEREHAGSARW